MISSYSRQSRLYSDGDTLVSVSSHVVPLSSLPIMSSPPSKDNISTSIDSPGTLTLPYFEILAGHYRAKYILYVFIMLLTGSFENVG